MANGEKGSVLSAIIWMFLISLLLFWLPVIGPLIAGIVGGTKAGSVGSAIVAVFLPGIVLGLILFVFTSTLSGLPFLGMIAAAGGFALVLANVGPLLLGAILGGILA
jgi:hypothetical protein